MKIKLNYILIAVIAVLTILCGYLLVDKFVLSTSKTITCKYFKDEETTDYEVKRTLKVNSTGKVVKEKTEIITTYDKESDYKAVKEFYAAEKKDAVVNFNDKKLIVTDTVLNGKIVDPDGNEVNMWYVSYVDGLKESGYTCK